MENSEILLRVDHTLLKPTAVWAQIEKLCTEALQYKMASVCIPPSFVAQARAAFPHLNVCTVIGFPLGYNSTKSKMAEAQDALQNGADELDMVVNLCNVKDGEFEKVKAEIAELKKLCASKILKVIIETCYLTESEKINLCKCVTDAGADFIKTSTGFGSGGAEIADIELFKKHIGSNVKIKAAGGIRTREAMEQFCMAGCARIGCSAAITALGLE